MKKRIANIISRVCVLFFLQVFSFFFFPSIVYGDWLSGYTCRAKIPVNVTTAGEQSDYQMKITVYKGNGTNSAGVIYCNNKCQTWPNDIRFTDADGITEKSHWLEFSDATSAIFWIKLDSPAAGEADYYIYYGKAGAGSASSESSTFVSGAFIDVFNDDTMINTIDSSNIDVSGEEVKLEYTVGNWMDPMGYNDPGDKWDFETSAYDNNLGSSAYYRYEIYETGSEIGWSYFLELTHTGINSDKIRFYAVDAYDRIDKVDIDVYNGSGWVDVYEGNFTSDQWEEKSFTADVISKARVRWNSTEMLAWGKLYELDFWKVEGYELAGTLCSVTVPQSSSSRFAIGKEFSWNDTEVINTDVKYQIEYYNGSWQLIPDSDLSGNSTGFSDSPIDISSIKIDYGQIRLRANLSTTDTSVTSSIQDWRVTYYYRKYVEPEPTWANPGNEEGIDHFVITGNSTQTAGSSQVITVTAKTNLRETCVSYTGNHTLSFWGPNDAPDGTPTTVNDIDIEQGVYNVTLNFLSGETTATLKVYTAETTTLDVSDGDIDSTEDASYDLDLTVGPGSADGEDSSISSVLPDPGTVGNSETIVVTAYDRYQNPLTSGGDTVTLSVSGADSATPSVTDLGDGQYTAEYTPTVKGIDNITGTINGADIGRDGDGVSDGVYHLTVGAGEASYFKITGASGMTAGGSTLITITTYDEYDNKAEGYKGDKNLIFSGANPSSNPSIKPTCSNKSGVDIEFGLATVVNFAGGEGSSTMKLYKAETAHIEATEGLITTSDENDLDITISAATKNKLLWATQPQSIEIIGQVWTPLTIEIADQYGNRTSDVDNITVTPSKGSFGGTVTKQAVLGLATFDDITYDTIDTITVTGSSGSLIDTPPSESITIKPSTLEHFLVELPETGITGVGFSIKVIAKDAKGNITPAVSGLTILSVDLGTISVASIPEEEFTDYGIWIGEIILNLAGEREVTVTNGVAYGSSTVMISNPLSLSSTAFTDSEGNDESFYTAGIEDIYITVTDWDENSDSLTKQVVRVVVSDSKTSDSETVSLIETTGNSGVFRNSLGLSSSIASEGIPNNGNIEVTSFEDIISVTYTDGNDASDKSSDTVKVIVPFSKNRLHPNFPNPFRPYKDVNTTIQYDLKEDVKSIKVQIYTLSGELIKEWDGETTVGRHRILWDGKNEYRNAVSSGMYIVVIKKDDKVIDRKRMVIIK